MESVVFAVPTLAESEFRPLEQKRFLAVQATAAIVTSYLEHATAMAHLCEANNYPAWLPEWMFKPDELESLIKTVGEQLRKI